MAKQTLARLKAWFGKGKMPTESQFADLMDSFWHKDEELAVAAVKGLAQVLNGKYNESDARILRETVEAMQRLAESHGTAIERHGERISELTDAVGAPGGLAPLDESGKVDARYLPSYVDDVVEFVNYVGYSYRGIVEEPPTATGEWNGYQIFHEGISYDTNLNRFVDVYTLSGGISYSVTYLVSRWEGMDAYGEYTDTGVQPVKGKIYVCEGSRKMYRWCGTCLCELPVVLELGEGLYQAYSGARGKSLEQRMTVAERRMQEIQEPFGYISEITLQAETEQPYASLEDAIAYMAERADRLPGTWMPGMRVVFRLAEGEGYRWVTYRFWEGPNDEWDPILPECWELVR